MKLDDIKKNLSENAESLVNKLSGMSKVKVCDPDPSKGGACLTNDEYWSSVGLLQQEIARKSDDFINFFRSEVNKKISQLDRHGSTVL